MKASQVSILGTVYTIYDCKSGEDEVADSEFDAGKDGYTDPTTHEIILRVIEPGVGECADLAEARRRTLRHEITHALLFESGLAFDSNAAEAWAVNEEMVDWFAHQAPKLFKAFKEAGCL